MKISKNTVKELLELYLREKEITCDNKEKIVNNLFKDVNKKLESQKKKEIKEVEREKKRAKKTKLNTVRVVQEYPWGIICL